uniref:Protein kinase domain-containing protein n=1 Tax=Romanomermis culicivorax TaxID=13658 RepID=A0A915J6H2_ROMCU
MKSSGSAVDILDEPPLIEDFDGLQVDGWDIAQTLVQLKLIPALCFSDTLLPARQKFQATAANLLKKANVFVNDLNVSCKIPQIQAASDCGLSRPCTSALDGTALKENQDTGQHITVLQSRYYNDYEEISCLGKGGFGQVHKVRSYIDDQYYAVKKISFDLSHSDLCIKSLREVKILARLNHPNIVRYYGAWLEFVPSVSYNKGGQNSLSHTRDRRDSRHCQISEINSFSDESITNLNGRSSLRLSCSSPSIVFKDQDKEVSLSNEEKHDKQLALVNKNKLIQGSLSEDNIFGENGSSSSSEGSSRNFSAFRRACDIRHRKNIRQWPLARSLILYMKMELGSLTLRDWINKRNDSIPTSSYDVFLHVDSKRNEKLIKQMLEGLNYIHQLGIQHRDIKPSNILISQSDDRILLGDFGLACLTAYDDCIEEKGSRDIAAHKSSGKIIKYAKKESEVFYRSSGIGTLSYSAPEQLRSHCYNQKTFLIKRLVQNSPASRPTAKELLDSDFFQSSNDLTSAMRKEVRDLKFENQTLKRENLLLKGVIDMLKNHAQTAILKKA